MQDHTSYQMCTRCVMDTSDPEITFDAQGHCNHCTSALQRLEQSYFPDERGRHKLEKLLDEIRQAGKGKPYDCLIGISGGIDSSWLTYKSRDWGLRPFIFHVDGGWNAEVAERNISRLLGHLGYELHTYKVDWAEMRDVQRAYLESSLANQDVPQDHLFFAVLFHQAAQMGIKYWLSGSNLVSESILPRLGLHGHGCPPAQGHPQAFRPCSPADIPHPQPLGLLQVLRRHALATLGEDHHAPQSHAVQYHRIPRCPDQGSRLGILRPQACGIPLYQIFPELLPAGKIRLRQKARAPLQPHRLRGDHAGTGSEAAAGTAV